MNCKLECQKTNKKCRRKSCKFWIKHGDDLNCALIAIDNNNNVGMTLEEIGIRLGYSYEGIRQIEKKALEKLRKNITESLYLHQI